MIPQLRTTAAVGFDVVVPIDLDSYRITEDAAGRAYALVFDDAREKIVDAVERELMDVVGRVDVEVRPGYVRVRTGVVDEATTPKAVHDAIRAAASTYNDRHATSAELDGLAFDHAGTFLATYRPEDAPDAEAFLDRHAPDDPPEADGPVFEYHREDAGLPDAVDDARRFGYRVQLPLDAEMYDTETGALSPPSRTIEWDADAVQKALTNAVEAHAAWPGHPDNLPHVTVYPTHVAVDYYGGAPARSPDKIADGVRTGILRYNQYRPERADRGRNDPNPLHAAIDLDHTAHVAALDHGRTADEWIADRGLDDVVPSDDESDGDDTDDLAADVHRDRGVFSTLSTLVGK